MRVVKSAERCGAAGLVADGRCLLARAARTAAAQDYPARNVTILVPFAPGGGTDILARVLAQKLEQRLGKPFVIENRAGAGTVLAAGAAAKAAPDGYTLMQATSGTMAMNGTIFKSLPYDPATDLVPVSLVAAVPFVLVVNASLPVHSVADLVKLAKEKPLNYGSGGPGAFHHLNAELFSSMVGIKMTHVPYKGSAPALTDLVAGHIQVLFTDLAPALELIRAGKVRVLGITTAEPRRGRAGNSAAREGRRARLRHRRLADDGGAGQDAAADPRRSSTPRSMPSSTRRR